MARTIDLAHVHDETDTPIILSLETATPGGSLFVGRGETELAALVGDPLVSHSNNLLRDIDACLSAAQISLNDVEVFACAAGPGSFTGLRIGLATLKALAATLERPCLGIPTLRALAHAAGPSSSTVAVLPAGRGEVFAQMFSYSESDGVTELDEAAHLSPGNLVEKYGAVKNLVWVGPGAYAQREFLTDYTRQRGIALRRADSALF